MGPVTALRSFFGGYFDVEGRSRRFEYVWITLIQTIGFVVGVALIAFSEGSIDAVGVEDLNLLSLSVLAIMALWSIGTIIPWITLHIRRFHDMGYTGWIVALFIGLWLIPPLGALGSVVQFFWVLFGSGTAGLNPYGPDPRFSGSNVFS